MTTATKAKPPIAFNPPSNYKIRAGDLKASGNGVFIPGLGHTVKDRAVGEGGAKDENGKPLFSSIPSRYGEGRRYGLSPEKLPLFGAAATVGRAGATQYHREVQILHRNSPTFPDGVPVGETFTWKPGEMGRHYIMESSSDLSADERLRLKCLAYNHPHYTHTEKLNQAKQKDQARTQAALAASVGAPPPGSFAAPAIDVRSEIARQLEEKVTPMQEENDRLRAQLAEMKARLNGSKGQVGAGK